MSEVSSASGSARAETSAFDEFFNRCFTTSEARTLRTSAIVVWNGALSAAKMAAREVVQHYLEQCKYEYAAGARDAAEAVDAVRKVQD